MYLNLTPTKHQRESSSIPFNDWLLLGLTFAMLGDTLIHTIHNFHSTTVYSVITVGKASGL